jgi:serine-type D-Ala-D-Ala carboxypeptidase
MKYSVFEDKLVKKIEPHIAGATPGLLLQVHHYGRKIADISLGDTYAYYDLASLTKIIFTTQAMLWSFNNNLWNANTKVIDILGWFPYEDTTLIQLLNHSSGFTWWMPFHKEITLSDSTDKKWETIARIIREMPRENLNKPSVYSDVGFLILAFVLEKIYQKNINEVWLEIKNLFYPDSTFEMHKDNQLKFDRKYYAPTEKCIWRHSILQGEVHDENTWALGGVSAHAGLFGSIDDVGWFGLFIRSQLLGVSRTLVKQKNAQFFARRSRPAGGGDWAIGYMMPSPGLSTSGEYFSSNSIGHTGFTGSSFWYDPEQDLSVTILSNRLAFGRDNDGFKKLRPQIHNWVIEILRRN